MALSTRDLTGKILFINIRISKLREYLHPLADPPFLCARLRLLMQISVAKSMRRNATVPNTVAKITEIGFEVLLAPGVPCLFVVGFSEGDEILLVNVPLTAMVCVTVAPRASVVTMSTVDD
jgi:hypothetical protein